MSNEIKVLDKGKVALLDVMGSDKAIADAARISYSSNKKKQTSDDRTLIRYLVRNKHTSCLEMASVKFFLKMPIFVHNQVVRHRTASQNVTSGRYSEMPDEFYVPDAAVVTKQDPHNKQGGNSEVVPAPVYGKTTEGEDIVGTWKDDFEMEQADDRENYERRLNSGMRKELARINLPLSQYTELYWKIDLHNFFHFIKLRLDRHAQLEVRVFAQAMYDLVKPKFPLACQAFEDYLYNAQTLTTLDIQVTKTLYSSLVEKKEEVTEETLKAAIEKHISNKRERQECFNKLIDIFGIEL